MLLSWLKFFLLVDVRLILLRNNTNHWLLGAVELVQCGRYEASDKNGEQNGM